MKKWLRTLTLCATLGLSNCGTLDGTVDRTGVVLEKVVTHTTEELGKLKTETLKEVKSELSELRTETLREVRETVKEITPQLVEDIMNSDSVAFLIVSITGLIGFVVVVAGLLLLGAAKALWRRLGSRSKTQLASKTDTAA